MTSSSPTGNGSRPPRGSWPSSDPATGRPRSSRFERLRRTEESSLCRSATFLFLNCACGFANAAELRKLVDNLRQVGIALHAHESARASVAKGVLLGGVPQGSAEPNFSVVFAGRTMLGALGQLLPYVEEGKLAGLFGMNRGLTDPTILPPPFSPRPKLTRLHVPCAALRVP